MERSPVVGMFSACPVCASLFTAFVRKVPTRRTKTRVNLYTCLDCASFWNPSGYHEDDAQLDRDVEWGRGVAERNRVEAKRLFARFERRGVFAQSVVEVGCGIGSLVHVAEERGMSAIGFDVNTRAIEAGRELYSVDLRAEPWTKDTDCGTPDLILSLSVLEHLASPRPLFAEMCAAAKASGSFLFVSVPMVDRADWEHIRHPDPRATDTWLFDNDVHVTHFSPQGLRGLFEEHGASQIHAIKRGSWKGYLAAFQPGAKARLAAKRFKR